MALSGDLAFGTQWGTGQVNEVSYAGGQPDAAVFSCVTPTDDADSTFTTVFSLGSYCLQAVYNGQAKEIIAPVIGTRATAASHSAWTTGFFFRPKTNPNASFDGVQLVAMDDGVLNGWGIKWKPNLKLSISSIGGGGDYQELATTADTASVYESGANEVTNPWYFIAMRQHGDGSGLVTVRVYRWKQSIAGFPSTPTEEMTVNLGTTLGSIVPAWLRIGSTQITPVGDVLIANPWVVIGGGAWGPVGASMKTGYADGSVVPITNLSTQWQASSAGAYSGTSATFTATTMTVAGTPFPASPGLVGYAVTATSGAASGQSRHITANTTNSITFVSMSPTPAAGDTYKINIESNDIDDNSDTDYLYNATATASKQQHHMANGIISGTPNILGVQAGLRAKVDGTSLGTCTIYLRDTTVAPATTLTKASDNTGVIPNNASIWWHHWVCTSKQNTAQEQWEYGDIDNISVAFGGIDSEEAGREMRISSVYITVVYGTDQVPNTAVRAQTQVV